MNIYLDTRDLIDLLRWDRPVPFETFARQLEAGGHRLVLSMATVFEFARPLRNSHARGSVTRDLNRLEETSPVYLQSAAVTWGELRGAVSAFLIGIEPSPVDPFVHRFDHAVAYGRPPSTANYLKYGLAETVFDLAHADSGIFMWNQEQIPQLRAVVELERRFASLVPSEPERFELTFGRHLARRNIDTTGMDRFQLARWVYSVPERCPALRLQFDVLAELTGNVHDEPKEGDIDDFTHVDAVPYVDLVTLDARMRAYVKQAARRAGSKFADRLCANAAEVLARF